MVEVAAVQGQANANLAVGYGFTGILVSFIARHNPLGDHPGRDPARRHQRQRRPAPAPARPARRLRAGAQGIIFVIVLASETLYGRFRIFRRGAR